MQKNIIIIIICLVLIAIISGVKKKDEAPAPKAKHNTALEKSFKTEWLKNVDFSVHYLSSETIAYLKTHSEIKEDYGKGKKIIIYPADISSCPYGQAFLTFMEETKNEPKNAENYIFHPRQYSGYGSLGDIDTYEEIDKIKQQAYDLPSDILFLTKSDAKLERGFRDTCSIVCIVNPKTNQLISFDGAGPSLGVKLQGIFDQLKDW